MADGFFVPLDQGGDMAGRAITNVRQFPVVEAPSKFGAFLIKIGAKEMVTPNKKETDGAAATRWNQSVLGLAATVLVLVSALVTVVVNYASLSADFRNYQKTTDEKIIEIKQKIDKVEDWQRADSLQKAKIDGYKAGRTDATTGEHDEKEKK
jgi:hypothetical protein